MHVYIYIFQIQTHDTYQVSVGQLCMVPHVSCFCACWGPLQIPLHETEKRMRERDELIQTHDAYQFSIGQLWRVSHGSCFCACWGPERKGLLRYCKVPLKLFPFHETKGRKKERDELCGKLTRICKFKPLHMWASIREGFLDWSTKNSSYALEKESSMTFAFQLLRFVTYIYIYVYIYIYMYKE